MTEHPVQQTIHDRVNSLIIEFYNRFGVLPKELHCGEEPYAEIKKGCFDDTVFTQWRSDCGLMYCGLKLIPDSKSNIGKLEVK